MTRRRKPTTTAEKVRAQVRRNAGWEGLAARIPYALARVIDLADRGSLYSTEIQEALRYLGALYSRMDRAEYRISSQSR